MDIASIIGLVGGAALLVWAIAMGSPLQAFVHLPSMLITYGGTAMAMFVQFPLESIKEIPRIMRKVFVVKKQDPTEVIAMMVGFAQKARREGLLALEDEAQQLDDEFLKKGIQLVVDGTDPQLVRNILEVELTFLEERHSSGAGILVFWAATAPGFGMVGTLIGLIQMLGNLNDPSSLGPGMATALITTFYGALAANWVFNPMAQKLKARSSEEILLKEVMIEGILSIQAGENPRIVEEKLKAFLAPGERQRPVQERGAPEGVGVSA
ncbi:MAG: motility protein A [Bacillota bacterium]|nr:motility protein A [Bacillota bacterium]